MKAILLLFLLFIIKPCLGQFSHSDFEKLYGLKGKWKMEQKEGYLVEEWLEVSNHMLVSKSYMVRDKDTVLKETVRLDFKDGDIYYSPIVINQNDGKEVRFKLINTDNEKFVFENKEHDFPQQIIYQFSKNKLNVVINGNTAKGFREIPFSFTRIE
ncbi:MAG TPA: DUF6265 family protein [Chitinophagaceae bacterium]